MRTQADVTLFRLHESGSGTWGYNGVKPAGINIVNAHEWTVYSDLASEQYSYEEGHEIVGLREKHVWHGVDFAFQPKTITTDAPLADWNGNTGLPLRVKLSCSSGYHWIESCELLGDLAPFDASLSGSWSASAHDGYGNTVTSTLTLALGVGSARCDVSNNIASPGVFVASAQAEVLTDFVGRGSWRVKFVPTRADGSIVTRPCLVILGVVDTAGHDLQDYPDDVAQLIHYRDSPIDQVFGLPIERVACSWARSCRAYYLLDVSTAISDVGDFSKPFSTRQAVHVVFSRRAFDPNWLGTKLDDLNASSAINLGSIESYRFAEARFIPEAGATCVRRCDVRLPAVSDLSVEPWWHDPGTGEEEWGAGPFTSPPGGPKAFWSYFGRALPATSPFISLRPYRYLEISASWAAAGSAQVDLSWFTSTTGGSKTYTVGFPAGSSTMRIDLRDPDLVNLLDSFDRLESIEPGQTVRTPLPVVAAKRFDGFGEIQKLQITLPAGSQCTVTAVRLVADSGSLWHWRGDTPLGALIDSADALRVGGSDAKWARDRLAEQRVIVSNEAWAMPSGWTSQTTGKSSVVQGSWIPVAVGDLISGCSIYSTHLMEGFVGYWGMGSLEMLSREGATCEFEYWWAQRLTSQAVPPIAGAELRIKGLLGDERLVTTEASGVKIFDDIPDWYAPGRGYEQVPPGSGAWIYNVRAYAPSHPLPRVEAQLPQFGAQPGSWRAVSFVPAGISRPGSRDVNAGQRHVRAVIRDGRLMIGIKGNAPGDTWNDQASGINAQAACARVDRATKEQTVWVLVQRDRNIELYKTRIDGEGLELVPVELGAGESPAIAVLQGGLKACYWVSGSLVFGAMLGGDGSIARAPEVVLSGVTAAGLSAEAERPKGVWLTAVVGGQIRQYFSQDGLTFGAWTAVGVGDQVQVVPTGSGRRFVYRLANENVYGSVLDSAGNVVAGPVLCVGAIDQAAGFAARMATGPAGNLFVEMTVVQNGIELEKRSDDGLLF